MAYDSGLRIEGRGERGTTSNITNGKCFGIYIFKDSRSFDASDAMAYWPGLGKVDANRATRKSRKVGVRMMHGRSGHVEEGSGAPSGMQREAILGRRHRRRNRNHSP
jgi:hypothetical protein